MAFKDLLNRGVDMFNKGMASAKNAVEEKKRAGQEFDLLKTRSDHIGPMSPYVENNADPQPGKEQMILNACLTINVENSKLVNKLIPIDETVVDVKTSKEAKTEIEYIFVATDKKLWILNKNEYMTLEYGLMQNFEIINKGLMSQSVKFNNNAFIFDGKEADIVRFGNILLKQDFRNEVTKYSIAYLCGVVPSKQVINVNLKGITIGSNGELVLHNSPDNKAVNINEVTSVQLLINDTVCLSRGKGDTGSITSSPMEARKMSVKIIFGMGEYVIETMAQSMMNTTYRREDSVYRSNYEFSKLLVETIAGYLKDEPKGISPVNGVQTSVQMNSQTNPQTQVISNPIQNNSNNGTNVGQNQTVSQVQASVGLDPFGIATPSGQAVNNTGQVSVNQQTNVSNDSIESFNLDDHVTSDNGNSSNFPNAQ